MRPDSPSVFRRIVVLAAALVGGACRSPSPQADSSTDVSPRPPAISTAADLLPTPDRLFQATPALAVHATTILEIGRGASTVTLRDDKDIRRLASGDFDLSIRRIHQGSEAGDTEESFRAIRVGKDYFTRGSGGPFVHWDDALDEPARTLDAVAGESRALLAFLAPCLAEQATSEEVLLGLARPDCPLSSAPDAAPMSAVVVEFQGRLRGPRDRPAQMDLTARLNVTAGGHQATVLLRHEAAWNPMPEHEVIALPSDVVSSRRERPVRMVESVLAGLVAEWGPGAPASLKAARSVPPSGPPSPLEADAGPQENP